MQKERDNSSQSKIKWGRILARTAAALHAIYPRTVWFDIHSGFDKGRRGVDCHTMISGNCTTQRRL